jgi:hypothetical protein
MGLGHVAAIITGATKTVNGVLGRNSDFSPGQPNWHGAHSGKELTIARFVLKR